MKARAKDRRWFRRGAVPEEPTESASRRAAHPVQPNIRVIEPIRFTPDELRSLSAAVGVVSKGRDPDMDHFWNQFEHADLFGSLIQPDAEALAEAKAWLVGPVETTQAAGGAVVDLLTGNYLDRAQRVINQADLLTRQYAVVIANPPYMGSGNMSALLSTFLKENYPDSKSDLMTAFMERATALVEPSGYWGMINLAAWMTLSSYEKLRAKLLRSQFLVTMAHFGRGVFGSDFATTGFVVQNCLASGRRGIYRKLFEKPVDVRSNAVIETLFRDPAHNRFVVDQAEFSTIPGSPIVYWLSEKMRAAFSNGRPLGEVAAVRQGLKTAENPRFLRFWWEVASSQTSRGADAIATASDARWFPYNKGGDFRRWWGNHDFVVNWHNDGAEIRSFGVGDGVRPRSRVQATEYYFKESLSWNEVSSGEPAFRVFPKGFIFDSTGSSAFFVQDCDILFSAAVANSSLISCLLNAIAPGLRFDIGQIAKIPVMTSGTPDRTLSQVNALVATSRSDWNSYETSWDFTVNPLVAAHRDPAAHQRSPQNS